MGKVFNKVLERLKKPKTIEDTDKDQIKSLCKRIANDVDTANKSAINNQDF